MDYYRDFYISYVTILQKYKGNDKKYEQNLKISTTHDVSTSNSSQYYSNKLC